jgi:hypothetical protein
MTITAAVLGVIGIGPMAEIFTQPEAYTCSVDYSWIKPAPKPDIIPLPPFPIPRFTPFTLPSVPAVKTGKIIKSDDSNVIKRKTAFREKSGIINLTLENIYESADKDSSGNISWSEVEIFQNKIFNKYSYIPNNLALRPDEFIQQGGGDCEDWALFTCGLLQYWDIVSYVGSFGPENGTGHAVCLVPLDYPPKDYSYYELEGLEKYPDGFYVPIDYNHVGSLSNAVGKRWFLRMLYNPSEIYGLDM